MVQTAYDLGPDYGTKVTKLQLNVTYIFPTQNVSCIVLFGLTITYIFQDRALVRHTKLFHHPAIWAAVQQVFGKGFAEKHSDCFTSSISTGPQSIELEMPIPITAFVATCVSS